MKKITILTLQLKKNNYIDSMTQLKKKNNYIKLNSINLKKKCKSEINQKKLMLTKKIHENFKYI